MTEEPELTDDQLWELTTTEDPRERAEAMVSLGWRLYKRDENEKAISLAGQARALYKELYDFQEEGRAAFLQGLSHYDAGQFEESIACFDSAADLYRVWATEEMLADSVRNKARALSKLERIPEAFDAYQSAIALYESNSKYTAAGIAALDLGEMLGADGQQSLALETFTNSLRIFKLGGDLIGSGRAHDRMAAALIDLGNLYTAVEHLREALNIFTYIEDFERKTWALYRLGWTLVSIDECHEAIPLLREASAAYKETKYFTSAANADTQLAHALNNIGEVDEAIELYKMTRSIYEAAGDMHSAYIADINTADKLVFRDRDRAIAIYRRVVTGAREINDSWLGRVTSLRLAESLNKVDTPESYQEAIGILEAINIAEWGEDLSHRTRHLNALADTLIELNRDEESVTYLQEVVDYGYETGFLAESARAHVSLAFIEDNKGNIAASHELLARAIAFYLAAGEDDLARNLSKRLLPPEPQGKSNLQSGLTPGSGSETTDN